jgi:Icc-related predicted phosphoesterase
MKIQIASDLHLEFLKSRKQHKVIGATDADVLLLAGDIHSRDLVRHAFGNWAGTRGPCPVIHVAGNHEFYHQEYHRVRERLKAGIGPMFHHLENDEIVIDGVRFLGCTLWTDYALYGDVPTALMRAKACMNDHRVIRFGARLFTPQDALQLHRESRAWLARKLDAPFIGKTVVVTHHCPHPLSVHPRYGNDPLNAAYASDLSHLMGKAALWIHGHVHNSFDYVVNGTRVMANPRGYPLNPPRAKTQAAVDCENAGYRPQLVVEI